MRLRTLPVFMADGSTVQLSFLVPMGCITYITYTAVMNLRRAGA